MYTPMSMWLPGGAGASSCSGASTTCRTCWATSQTSTTLALPHLLWLVAATSEPATHEARRGLLAVPRYPAGHLGALARLDLVAVPRVLRGGHRAERGRGVGRPAVVAARLRGDHAGHDAAGPHAARVDVEVVEVVSGVGLDPALLRLQHHLVLEEDARHAFPEPGGDHLLVEAPVAGEGPQVEAGAVGLGRHRVDHGAGDALAAVAVQGAGARLRDADV